MSATVQFLPAAERDIDENADYIFRDSLDAALRFYAAVPADAKKLAEMPGMGPVYGLKDPKWADVRFWPITGFRNFLLFYRPTNDGIVVLRVMHGARDINRRFD